MENFIQSRLRIINWEQPLIKLQELSCPLEVKGQLFKFWRQRAEHEMTYYWQCTQPRSKQVMCHGHRGPV